MVIARETKTRGERKQQMTLVRERQVFCLLVGASVFNGKGGRCVTKNGGQCVMGRRSVRNNVLCVWSSTHEKRENTK